MVPEQRELFLANLDWASAELRNQDLVARLYAGSNPLALLVKSTRSDSKHLGFVEFLHGGLGQEDTSCGLGLGLQSLDEDAVKEGSDRTD